MWFCNPMPSNNGVLGGRERDEAIARPNTWTSACKNMSKIVNVRSQSLID